jgi:hypothetical protein
VRADHDGERVLGTMKERADMQATVMERPRFDEKWPIVCVYIRRGAHRNQRIVTISNIVPPFGPVRDEGDRWASLHERLLAGGAVFEQKRDALFVIDGEPSNPNNPNGSPWHFSGAFIDSPQPSIVAAIREAQEDIWHMLAEYQLRAEFN